ncbi:MAG: phospho-N-acetylmuramoyl-pentapeptide-transferase [Clostridia bacterium]|nr:phospho-N-acetylmuramoyl-pentapeptide-transferase [Clostridia bacterium]
MAKGILYGAVLLLTFVLTVIILRFLIPYLKSKKMGQKILDIGPRWHKNKEGTPAMGGLAFIIASFAVLAAAVTVGAALGVLKNVAGLALVYGYALLNGLIGTVDDRTKFKKGQNQGLTAVQKYALQFLAAAVFLFVGVFTGLIPGRAADALYIPFFGAVPWMSSAVFRVFYYVFSLLLLTGIVNAVNLTDGIDGLSSSVTLTVGVGFTVLCAFVAPSGNEEGLILSAALIGSCGGFLVYNFHPAKVFMGDTGSLFLGGYVIGLAFLVKNPLIVIFFGIVYILETLSVILQVGYFKLTHGKRLFKMSPIHHHFEKCGWSEVRIVSVFSAVALLFCFVGLIGCGLFS